jgi:tripartite-type tricarboxylate transporter receptor subunit TctC
MTGDKTMNTSQFVAALPGSLLATARALTLLGAAAGAYAQNTAPASFPNQPIKIVVPAAPGGGTDLMARILATTITQNAGWTMVVDNKAGASGIIGADCDLGDQSGAFPETAL